MEKQRVISFDVNCVSPQMAMGEVFNWVAEKRSAYVCVANVHMVMEAFDDVGFRSIVQGADMVVPDGMPLVWVMRALGQRDQQRVRGPDLMPSLCAQAESRGLRVGFIGGSQKALDALCARLRSDFKTLNVVYAFSPPFRVLSDTEKENIIAEINQSHVDILFVGLGCPKQERWMAAHRGQIKSVMLGVGAAFDLYSGTIRECPRWLQSLGLEWLYRFKEEPRRLLGRYFKHNPRFILFSLQQILGLKSFKNL